MQLAQIYANATNAFQNDPELRNLLLATMDAAGAGAKPAEGAAQPPVSTAAKMNPLPMVPRPESAQEQFMMSGTSAPPPALAASRQGVTTAQKSAMPAPPPPAPSAPAYNPAQQFAPNAGGAALAAQAARPQPPMAAAAPPRSAGPSFGQQASAFLQGLGTSDAILPALGGGMAAVENLERSNEMRNRTVRALMSRGLDADAATAASQNPEILKAVLPSLFGGGERKLGEAFDETGQPYKFFYNEKGAANIEPVGGAKRDPGHTAVTRAQGTANVKRVEKYKSEADSARTLLADLGQIKTLRGDVPDLLKGLPPGMGTTIGRWTDYFGATNNVMALNPKELDIQLGFTERTKGAITDREMGLFAGGVPGLGMTDEAAAQVITGMEAAANRKVEQAKFFESWLGRNRGSLEGAQDAWDSYINANPIIMRGKDGKLTVNNKNIGNWREYVDGEDAGTGEPYRQPNRGQPTNDGPVSQGIEGMGENAAGSGGATDASRYPVVNTQEEYDALPPGATYIDIDEATGRSTQYTKPKR